MLISIQGAASRASVLVICVWMPWVLLLLLFPFSPVRFEHSPLPALLVVIPSLLVWTAVALNAQCIQQRVVLNYSRAAKTNLLIWCLFWVFIIGSYLNFFILEGGSMLALTERRIAAIVDGRSPSLLRGVLGLMAAVPTILLVWRFVFSRERTSKKRVLINCLIVLISTPPMLFSGGRNPLVLSFLFVILSAALINPKGFYGSIASKANWRNVFVGAATAFGIGFYIAHLALQRRLLTNTFYDYAAFVERNLAVTVSPIYDRLADWSEAIAVFYINISIYIQHSIVLLGRLLTLDTQSTGGFSTFPLYRYMIDFSFGLGRIDELQERLPFPGMYTTFWGPLIQDAGLVGVFLGVSLVAVGLSILLKRRALTFSGLLLLAFMGLNMAVSPIYLVTSTGFGSSLFLMIVVVSVVPRIRLF